MKKQTLVILLSLLASRLVQAQDFKWEAKIPPVKKDGFYNILLTPEVSQHLKHDLSDIRIYESTAKETPYLLKSETSSESTQFRTYEIVENKSIPHCCTHVILHNAAGNSINNISLIIKNSDVRKAARLSGSDDKINWYIIKDNYNLESIYNDRSTSEVKILDFPLSDYAFYKLDIDDSLNAPLKILRAGYYDSHVEEAKYISLPSPQITQTDSSDRKSYVKISFPTPQYVSRLKIEVASPSYFLRNARLCLHVKEKNKSYFNPIASLQLRSNHDNIFMPDYELISDLYLIIENKDDQPLKLKSVSAYQLIHYLTARLEKQKEYSLRFGDKKLYYPQYDLEFFKDSIQVEQELLKPQQPVNIEKSEMVQQKSFFYYYLMDMVCHIPGDRIAGLHDV